MLNPDNLPVSVLIMCSVRWFNASAHYALSLAQSLKDSGINVVLLGLPAGTFVAKAKELGLEVIDDIGLMNPGLFSYVKNIFKFRKILRTKRIDIINPHISRDHVFAFLSMAGRSNRIIRTRTDSKIPKNNILNKIFYNISARYYIVSSKYMVSHITRMSVPERNVIVIPPEMKYKLFTDYKTRRNLRRELNIPKNKLVVSFVGRLDRIKGVEYFLESHSYLKNKNDFYFLVSGEEINLTIEGLKQIAKAENIGNISFLGRVEDVRDILSITDIGVISSVGSESICRIGLEMLAFGIPVIGSDVNSIPELINDIGGIVVKPRSPDEIARAIEYLAVPENYKNMKRKISANISERSPDKFALEYTDLFFKVLET